VLEDCVGLVCSQSKFIYCVGFTVLQER
jgi:hypothetical protein